LFPEPDFVAYTATGKAVERAKARPKSAEAKAHGRSKAGASRARPALVPLDVNRSACICTNAQ